MTIRQDYPVILDSTGLHGTVSIIGIVYTGSNSTLNGDWKASAGQEDSYPLLLLQSLIPQDMSIMHAWYSVRKGFKNLSRLKELRVREGDLDSCQLYIDVEAENNIVDAEIEVAIHVMFKRKNPGPTSNS